MLEIKDPAIGLSAVSIQSLVDTPSRVHLQQRPHLESFYQLNRDEIHQGPLNSARALYLVAVHGGHQDTGIVQALQAPAL